MSITFKYVTQCQSGPFIFSKTKIFSALTGPKILAGTALIKAGSARLVLDLVAMFRGFYLLQLRNNDFTKNVTEKRNSISLDWSVDIASFISWINFDTF